MVIDQEEALLWSILHKPKQRSRFLRIARRRKHKVNEKDQVCTIDLMQQFQVQPSLVVLGSLRINDDIDLEFRNKAQIASNLLGDEMAVRVGVSNDEHALRHGSHPRLRAISTGMTNVTFAFARGSSLPPSDASLPS